MGQCLTCLENVVSSRNSKATSDSRHSTKRLLSNSSTNDKSSMINNIKHDD